MSSLKNFTNAMRTHMKEATQSNSNVAQGHGQNRDPEAPHEVLQNPLRRTSPSPLEASAAVITATHQQKQRPSPSPPVVSQLKRQGLLQRMFRPSDGAASRRCVIISAVGIPAALLLVTAVILCVLLLPTPRKSGTTRPYKLV